MNNFECFSIAVSGTDGIPLRAAALIYVPYRLRLLLVMRYADSTLHDESYSSLAVKGLMINVKKWKFYWNVDVKLAVLCWMNTIQYLPEAVRYMQQVFPWTHQSRRRKRHLNRFSRYCRPH